MNRLRMCESAETRLSIATPAFQHPRIIKSPPESLGTRLSLARRLSAVSVANTPRFSDTLIPTNYEI